VKLHRFPALIFIISFCGVAISLWLSRSFELVEHCRVFIDGCISISASGRQEPAVFVFRATIIPVGVLLMLVWWLNVHWLRLMGHTSRVQRAAIHLLGTASPVLLICYIALIGSAGEIDHAIRQAVITTYFPVTLMAKIILASLLLSRCPANLPRWLPHTMLAMAAIVLSLAVASVIFDSLMDDPSVAHNLMQWHGTTAFAAWYLLLARAWQLTGFSGQFDLRS
jgi:hypothetical protein